jgi:hypothetical protein
MSWGLWYSFMAYIGWRRNVFQSGRSIPIVHLGCKVVGRRGGLVRATCMTYPVPVPQQPRRYLNAHVQDGYRFLMKNYRIGDKICLFGETIWQHFLFLSADRFVEGFSRGAYTARALAGMLHKVAISRLFTNLEYSLLPSPDRWACCLKTTMNRSILRMTCTRERTRQVSP